MQVDLRGKVALVTGSAHRVGKAIALELARHGVRQVIHYHGSADQAEQTLAEVRALNIDAITAQANQAEPHEIAAHFAVVRAHFGRLDILVNSASMFERGDLLSLSYEAWQRALDVNLTGPFLCTQEAARLMRETQIEGVIINILDQSALRASPSYPQHSVSKAGLRMLTEVAARALAPDIRVNAIAPGLVLQPPDYDAAQWEKLTARTPIQRAGSADDVARAVVYLASEDYLTGTLLTVDGGESIT